MRLLSQIILLSLLSIAWGSMKAETIEKDTFDVGGKSLSISFIGHGSLCMDYDGYIIQIDPVGRYTDYSQQPDADLILITHAHGDHLDSNAVAQVEKANTVILLNEESQKKLQKGKVMKNGDTETVNGIRIKAVPAYNPNRPQHPKGRDNGYLLEIGNKRIYVAGDTEDIPELANLKGIDIAFLPINRPTHRSGGQCRQDHQAGDSLPISLCRYRCRTADPQTCGPEDRYPDPFLAMINLE